LQQTQPSFAENDDCRQVNLLDRAQARSSLAQSAGRRRSRPDRCRRQASLAMTRWRPPAPRSTAIITREGFEKLKSELDHLWHTLRPEVVKALAAAAAEGDRSENAEYTYRKKQLGEIDRRVRYLSKRIPALKVAEGAPADRLSVFFGALIELENLASGETLRYRIVGPDETDAKLGWISIDSPLARAVLKKKLDEEFEAELPGGRTRFALIGVDYPDA
jgi:transcription elongation factor GreB